MAATVEREIKLRFETADAARSAVESLGARPLRGRRLQDDRLLDWPDGRLGGRRCLLRVRREDGAGTLTFKGPPQAATMKVREEIETTVGDADALLTMLERLGLRVWFRYQKYRQEYQRPGLVVAVDETPVGTYAELEGDEAAITAAARALGRGPDDYILHSYRELFRRHREAHGLSATDMVFDAPVEGGSST